DKRASRLGQISHVKPSAVRRSSSMTASLPVGVRTSTRSARRSLRGLTFASQQAAAQELRVSREHALKAVERLADAHSLRSELQLTDRALVAPGTLLDHGQCLPDLARRLEVAEEQYRVSHVADVDRGPGRA